MCIFIGPVQEVRKTRILVAPIGATRQLIVYENSVKSNGTNAMILPVPSGERIDFIDLSAYPGDVWSDCESYFPRSDFPIQAMAFGGSFGGVSKETLAVQRVGGYTCSVVPSVDEFVRLSAGHFVVPPNISDILRTNYGTGFNFIVCVFDNAVAGHPLAYTSARLPGGFSFIPTRHAHGEPMPSTEHKGINCDGCGVRNFAGTRWRCLQCHDYDLCGRCATNPATKHDNTHPMLRLTKPVTREEFVEILHRNTDEFIDRGFGARGPPPTRRGYPAGFDEFDHTIYLVNSFLRAYPLQYSSMTHGSLTRFQNAKLMQLNRFVTGFGELNGICKVNIHGAFPNEDYQCIN
jgi:hypothetical protein